MARTRRPIPGAAAGNVLAMIAFHQDKPCPTVREIMDWTGVPRRRLAAFLADLQARGLIELETKGRRAPLRRRLRAAGMPWTDWTRRGQPAALRSPRTR
jgi:hypothetical protein